LRNKSTVKIFTKNGDPFSSPMFFEKHGYHKLILFNFKRNRRRTL
jgi:hypothetical protein